MTALVGLGWFGAFLRALSPTVGAEDSGEFAVVAATLGLSHAPGYPLYALAGRLALLLPAGDPAFRLNVMSAVSAAAACAALFALVRREAATRLGCGSAASVAAGLLASAAFGLGRALWHQATISDKYAFHLMLHAAIGLSAIRGSRPAAVALLTGVAFSHHLQTLYLVPGLGWLAWRARLRPKTWAVAATLAVIGVSPKLVYPPVRAVAEPAALAYRPASLARHVAYLRAKTYAARIGAPAAGSRWRDVGARLWSETAGLGAVAGLAGLAGWSPLTWLTVAAGLLLTASLDIIGREFYLLPVVWWLAAGTGRLAARGFAASRPARIGAALWAVAVVWSLARVNQQWYDRSRMTLERDYGLNLLSRLPPRTVVFASGDDVLFPAFYLQSVLGVRADVVMIPEGFLMWPFGRRRVALAVPEAAGTLAAPPETKTEEGWSRVVAATCLAAGRPVALTNPARAGIAAGWRSEIRDVVWEVFARRPALLSPRPRGLLTRGWHRPAGAYSDRQLWLIGLYAKYQRQVADRLANAGDVAGALPRFRLALANPYLPDRTGALNNYALAVERTGDRVKALALYRRALADPAAAPEVWINAGNLLLGLGKTDEAKSLFEDGLRRATPGSVHAAYAAARLATLK